MVDEFVDRSVVVDTAVAVAVVVNTVVVAAAAKVEGWDVVAIDVVRVE